MKPVRRFSGWWLSQLPRERRNALITALALLGVLGGLVLYQRWRESPAAPPDSLAGPAAANTGNTVAGADQADTREVATAGGQQAAPAAADAAAPSDSAAASNEPSPAAAEPPELAFPLAGEADILQPYAIAFSAAYGDYRLHPGVDYAAAEGDAALAAAAGTVVSVEPDPAEGVALTVDHGNGVMTRYAGLQQVMVREKSAVEQGSILGTVGRPPGGAKPHLHFEVLMEGDAVDPAVYLPQ